MEEKYNGLKLAERGARISIIAYIVLSLLKLGMGYLSSSKALTADGLNNTTDIVASLAVLIGLKVSRKPADDDHLYGHFRAETIASLISSLIMIGVGIDVLYNAARSIIFFKSEAPDLSVVEGHNITEEIEMMLRSQFNIIDVVVHVEPEF
ncbi:MAG: cation diffusion facilitator family transporter [Clostridiaceae bacterium]|nr:cation diffusion facilitator family transporter [Clostridiaceae bacterium]